MKPYTYGGTQRGELDPWAPKPKPEPASPRKQESKPCGTYPAYRRHTRAGEDPCPPCLEAKRAYDRDWRAGKTGTRTSKSGIRGVWWSERDQLWRAQVWHEGRNHTAGNHPTKEAAELAVVEKRNELHGRSEAA